MHMIIYLCYMFKKINKKIENVRDLKTTKKDKI